jgi:hypothetical protein
MPFVVVPAPPPPLPPSEPQPASASARPAAKTASSFSTFIVGLTAKDAVRIQRRETAALGTPNELESERRLEAPSVGPPRPMRLTWSCGAAESGRCYFVAFAFVLRSGFAHCFLKASAPCR